MILSDFFQEKQILQRAHGQRELAFSSANGVNLEAKRCVDMWLKMPGEIRILSSKQPFSHYKILILHYLFKYLLKLN